MGVALVIWSSSMITALRSMGCADFPAPTAGKALNAMYKALPNGACLDLVVETPDVYHSIRGRVDLMTRKLDQKFHCTVPEFVSLMRTWENQGTQTSVREFDEEGLDADCIKMHMFAIREADQAMRDAVNHRDHPTGFLA
jgi:hypothetical protein